MNYSPKHELLKYNCFSMTNRIDLFLELTYLFKDHKHRLYLVGGTVRDYLSATVLTDMDAVTDATPDEMKAILKGLKASFAFAKMGSVQVEYKGVKFDITTLRKEGQYDDSRHPSYVKFVKSLRVDSKRRDFTLNAMYINDCLQVCDYHHGQRDLQKNILKMIGNPDKRIKEDPLRIFRALRFVLTYKYEMDKKLEAAILNNVNLIDNLNKAKIQEEIKKIKNASEEDIRNLFDKFNINYDSIVVK